MIASVSSDWATNRWFRSRRFFEIISTVVDTLAANDDHNVQTELLELISPAKLSALLQECSELLLNPFKVNPKSPTDRLQLQRALESGERIKTVVIDASMFAEAVLFADCFNMNELDALDLVFAGEEELPNFPGWPRGLCGVLCFYNSAFYYAETLRLLSTVDKRKLGSKPLTKTSPRHPTMAQVIGQFLDGLWNQTSYIEKLLDVVYTADVSKELEKLDDPSVKGLGDVRHRKMVSELVAGVRNSLEDAVLMQLCWQRTPLSVDLFVVVVNRLCNSVADIQFFGRTELLLLISLLYAFDTSALDDVTTDLELSVFVPMTMDGGRFLTDYIRIIDHNWPLAAWGGAEMQAIIRLSAAVAVRTLAQHPIGQKAVEELEVDEEDLFDSALSSTTPLHVLRQQLLPLLLKERSKLEFGTAAGCMSVFGKVVIRRLSTLITDLIVGFPVKVKELICQTEDEIRFVSDAVERGEQTDTVNLHFEQLMLLIGDLYSIDDERLSDVFWRFNDLGGGTDSFAVDGSLFQSFGRLQNIAASTQKQLTLSKFVGGCAVSVFGGAAVLHVAFLQMAGGLVVGGDARSARAAFVALLDTNSADAMSWTHFFAALRHYHAALTSTHTQTLQIQPEELEALFRWLEFAGAIAEKDPQCRRAFVETHEWQALATSCGLLGCPVPLQLKQTLYKFLAQLVGSYDDAAMSTVAAAVWEHLTRLNILYVNSETASLAGGLEQELNQVECRSERYSASIGYLTLFDKLSDHSAALPAEPTMVLRPHLDFVLDSVLTKFMHRSYKDISEMWMSVDLSASILRKLVCCCNFDSRSFARMEPGVLIMGRILEDGTVFRSIMWAVGEATKGLNQYSLDDGGGSVVSQMESALYSCLQLLLSVVDRDRLYMDALRDVGVTSTTTSALSVAPIALHSLLLTPSVNSDAHCVNIALLLNGEVSRRLSVSACRLLARIASSSAKAHGRLSLLLHAKPMLVSAVASAVLSSTGAVCHYRSIVQGTEEEDSDRGVRGELAMVLLEMVYDSVKRLSTTDTMLTTLLEYNLGLSLLGFHPTKPWLSQLENPGVNGFPKTCLHGMLEILVTDNSLSPGVQSEISALVELSARILHLLASLSITCEPTLRYLRANHDLIFEMAGKWLVRADSAGIDMKSETETGVSDDRDSDQTLYTNRMSAVTSRLCAVEIRMLVVSGQRRLADRPITALTEDNRPTALLNDTSRTTTQPAKVADRMLTRAGLSITERSMTSGQSFSIASSLNGSRLDATGGRRKQKSSSDCVLLALLKRMDLKQSGTDQPPLKYFDRRRLAHVISACTLQKHETDIAAECDATKLHLLLRAEVDSLLTTEFAGEHTHVLQEAERVLFHCVAHNRRVAADGGRALLFGGWCRLTEVVFSVLFDRRQMVMGADGTTEDVPKTAGDGDAMNMLAVDLMAAALLKIATCCGVSEEVNLNAAQLVLHLTNFLRRPSSMSQLDGSTLIDTTADTWSSPAANERRQTGIRQSLNALPELVKLIIEFMLVADNRGSSLRQLIYGSLLNLLYTAKEDGEKTIDELWVVIGRYIPELAENLARDALDASTPLCQTLSTCCLSVLVAEDSKRCERLVEAMASKGYTRQLIERLVDDSSGTMKNCFANSASSVAPLYIYRARMGLFCRVASTVLGARLLVKDCKLPSRLPHCAFWTQVPSDLFLDTKLATDGIATRYLSALDSTLAFYQAICAKQGHSSEIAHQTLEFVSAHSELFFSLMRHRPQERSYQNGDTWTLMNVESSTNDQNLEMSTGDNLVDSVLKRAAGLTKNCFDEANYGTDVGKSTKASSSISQLCDFFGKLSALFDQSEDLHRIHRFNRSLLSSNGDRSIVALANQIPL